MALNRVQRICTVALSMKQSHRLNVFFFNKYVNEVKRIEYIIFRQITTSRTSPVTRHVNKSKCRVNVLSDSIYYILLNVWHFNETKRNESSLIIAAIAIIYVNAANHVVKPRASMAFWIIVLLAIFFK